MNNKTAACSATACQRHSDYTVQTVPTEHATVACASHIGAAVIEALRPRVVELAEVRRAER